VFPGCPTPSLAAVRELQKVMEDPNPKPGLVRSKAAAAVGQLDAWLASLQAAEYRCARLAPDLPRRLTHALADSALTPDRRSLRQYDWDYLAAHALGAGAMVHAAGGTAAAPEAAAEVGRVFDLLRFPPPVRGKRRRSPAGVERDKLRQVEEHFRKLSGATRRPRSPE
jgi:hypothetical protein